MTAHAVDTATASDLVMPERVVAEPKVQHSRIADYQELFKVRVTSMVVLTAWAGFYLGSMRSGITSMHWGLVQSLLGITLISCGASVLNQVIERKTDAKMVRTAQRPVAAGRFGLAAGMALGLACFAAGAVVLAWFTNPVTVMLTLLTGFIYVAVYTPLKRYTTLATFIGAFPGAMPPLLGWTAARGVIEWPAVALVRHFVRMAVSPFHGHRLALPRGLRQSRHPHAASGAAGWLVHGVRGAGLCGAHDSGQRGAVLSTRDWPHLPGHRSGAGFALPGVYRSLCPHYPGAQRDRVAPLRA